MVISENLLKIYLTFFLVFSKYKKLIGNERKERNVSIPIEVFGGKGKGKLTTFNIDNTVINSNKLNKRFCSIVGLISVLYNCMILPIVFKK